MKIKIIAECVIESKDFRYGDETDKEFLERLNDEEGLEAFDALTIVLQSTPNGTCKAEIVLESLPYTCPYCKSHEPEKHQDWCPTVTGIAPDCT